MFPLTVKPIFVLGKSFLSTFVWTRMERMKICDDDEINGFDIALVQRLLQHSSASTTQRYIGIEPQRIEQAIQNHANLI